MDVSDVIILVILAAFTILGAFRGLIVTLMGLAVSVTAWIGSAFVATALAPDIPWLLTFLVCFVTVQVLGAVLTRVLDLASKLPLIGFLNGLLGGFVGFVRGAVLLAVVCSIASGIGLIPQKAVDSGGLLALFSSFGTIPR